MAIKRKLFYLNLRDVINCVDYVALHQIMLNSTKVKLYRLRCDLNMNLRILFYVISLKFALISWEIDSQSTLREWKRIDAFADIQYLTKICLKLKSHEPYIVLILYLNSFRYLYIQLKISLQLGDAITVKQNCPPVEPEVRKLYKYNNAEWGSILLFNSKQPRMNWFIYLLISSNFACSF